MKKSFMFVMVAACCAMIMSCGKKASENQALKDSLAAALNAAVEEEPAAEEINFEEQTKLVNEWLGMSFDFIGEAKQAEMGAPIAEAGEVVAAPADFNGKTAEGVIVRYNAAEKTFTIGPNTFMGEAQVVTDETGLIKLVNMDGDVVLMAHEYDGGKKLAGYYMCKQFVAE
ncbi:MAG: hypothetical protein MJZ69_10860 [Bacteroidaceae bacterium]|nr:hypothetical protein [Bacteroidaceae bacterium]